MAASPIVSSTRPRRKDTSISRKFCTLPGRSRSNRRREPGKRTQDQVKRRRAMIAGSGIQASLPSGKKKWAMPGDSFSTGGSPSRADQQRIDRMLQDRMMLDHALLPPVHPELGNHRENDDREPDGPRDRIETLPSPENHAQKRKTREGHQQKGNQGSETCLRPCRGPDARLAFSRTRKLEITTAAQIVNETPARGPRTANPATIADAPRAKARRFTRRMTASMSLTSRLARSAARDGRTPRRARGRRRSRRARGRGTARPQATCPAGSPPPDRRGRAVPPRALRRGEPGGPGGGLLRAAERSS